MLMRFWHAGRRLCTCGTHIALSWIPEQLIPHLSNLMKHGADAEGPAAKARL